MTARLKTHPVIRHTEALRIAGPSVAIARQKVDIDYLFRGVSYHYKGLMVDQLGIVCPNCETLCLDLYPHKAGRGILCSQCLRRCEVVESGDQ